MPKILSVLERIYFSLGLVYFTEPFLPFANYTAAVNVSPSMTADTLPAVEDSSLLLLLRILVLGMTLFLSIIRWRRVAYLILRRRVFWVLMCLFPLSYLWSAVPDVTLRRGVVIVGFALFGVNFAARYSLREQLSILAWSLGLLACANLLFTLAVPGAGIESGEHAGAWRGLYFQKNPFARTMVLGVLVSMLAAFESPRNRKFFWFGGGLSVLLVILSMSKSALLILLVLLGMLLLFQFLKSNRGIVLPVLTTLSLAISGIAIFTITNAETVFKFLGRDITLTGRTTIWQVLLTKFMKHPWLGYGHQGFWRGMSGDSADVWYETLGFMSPNAHNGFLDIAIELGTVGILLFLLTFGKNYWRAFNWLRLTPSAVGLLPLTFLTFILLYNITESTINTPPLIWVLYASITTSVLTESIPLREPQLGDQYSLDG
jgi:exopolysaccharide production protein ExoQ